MKTHRLTKICTRVCVAFCCICVQQEPLRAQTKNDSGDPKPAFAAIPHPFRKDGRWGYIDNEGRVVIKPQFIKAHDFYQGRACVQADDKAGYIRTDGSWAFALPQGARAYRPFSEGRAWFLQSRQFGCVDPDGAVVIPPKYDLADDFSEGLAIVGIGLGPRERLGRPAAKPARYGVVDRDGHLVLPLQFDSISGFSDGLARVTTFSTATFSYIDRSGKVVLSLDSGIHDPHRFIKHASTFSDGRALLWYDGSAPTKPSGEFIDKRGARVGPQAFEDAWPFSEGLAAVVINGKLGYINKDAGLVLPPKFDSGTSFHEGLALVSADKVFQLIDRSGKTVAKIASPENVQWETFEDFHGGLARVHIGGVLEEYDHGARWKGGAWFYVNRSGVVVAPYRPDGDEFWGSLSGG